MCQGESDAGTQQKEKKRDNNITYRIHGNTRTTLIIGQAIIGQAIVGQAIVGQGNP